MKAGTATENRSGGGNGAESRLQFGTAVRGRRGGLLLEGRERRGGRGGTVAKQHGEPMRRLGIVLLLQLEQTKIRPVRALIAQECRIDGLASVGCCAAGSRTCGPHCRKHC